jgi:hypothetical protein
VSVPPRDAFAAAARLAIERHDEWDAPHAFETLHWDGEKLRTMTYLCIMNDVDPPKYPALMARAALEELEKHPDDPAYGYLLQVESHGVSKPGPQASEAEREQYERDRLGRTFHKRPDAVEVCQVWAADVHGRLWSATKRRGDESGYIHEVFYQPGRAPGGTAIRGLLEVAYATGMSAWGLPGPQGRMN